MYNLTSTSGDCIIQDFPIDEEMIVKNNSNI